MPGVARLRPCRFPGSAVTGKLAQGDVSAVAVARVGSPPAEDAFGAVSLADVLLAVRGVRDEVDSLDFVKGGAPVAIAPVLHQVAQFVVGEPHAVEPRERDLLPVGDLQHGLACCAGRAGAPVPTAGIVPFDHEPVMQRCQESCRAQVEPPVRLDAFGGHLAEVLEGSLESGAFLAVGDEDHPVAGRVRGEAAWRDELLPGVSEDALLRQVLRPTQRIRVVRLAGVADDVDVFQPDRRLMIGAHAGEHMAEGQGRAGSRPGGNHCSCRRIEGKGLHVMYGSHLLPPTLNSHQAQ